MSDSLIHFVKVIIFIAVVLMICICFDEYKKDKQIYKLKIERTQLSIQILKNQLKGCK